MNKFVNDNSSNEPSYKKRAVDEHFEQNAGVKIHKGKESYGGGSGFYAVKSKPSCPNVNDGGHCNVQAGDQSKPE